VAAAPSRTQVRVSARKIECEWMAVGGGESGSRLNINCRKKEREKGSQTILNYGKILTR